MQNIVYTSGGEEVLDKAKELWEKPNQLNATSSPDFEGYYADQTWKKRRGEISRRSRRAGIRVELAYAGPDRRLVGSAFPTSSRRKRASWTPSAWRRISGTLE
jgi:hypothetical protein